MFPLFGLLNLLPKKEEFNSNPFRFNNNIYDDDDNDDNDIFSLTETNNNLFNYRNSMDIRNKKEHNTMNDFFTYF